MTSIEQDDLERWKRSSLDLAIACGYERDILDSMRPWKKVMMMLDWNAKHPLFWYGAAIILPF